VTDLTLKHGDRIRYDRDGILTNAAIADFELCDDPSGENEYDVVLILDNGDRVDIDQVSPLF
jgi:hypothetical protein